MDRDKVEVNKNGKKERGQYPAILTKQAWSIKDLLYGQRILFCGNKAGNPEWARQAHLARLGSQSEHRIRFILPICRASHIIIMPW